MRRLGLVLALVLATACGEEPTVPPLVAPPPLWADLGASVQWVATDLGTLGGDNSIAYFGVNNAGQVAGSSWWARRGAHRTPRCGRPAR